MRARTIVTLALFALVAALVSAPSASAMKKYPTSVELNYPPGWDGGNETLFTTGKVQANPKCLPVRSRFIILYRVDDSGQGFPDSAKYEAGSDKSGAFTINTPNPGSGRYYVRVFPQQFNGTSRKNTYKCKGATSNVITL